MNGMASHHAKNYLEHLTNSIVAESKYEGDKYNIGKIALKTFKLYPDKLNQIDGGTGLQETNGVFRARVVACSRALGTLGLHGGDVLAVIARNHLDSPVPVVSGFVTGVAVLPIDPSLALYDLKRILSFGKPRVVFCDSDKVVMVQRALQELLLTSFVVAFAYGDVPSEAPVQGFQDLIAPYMDDEIYVPPTFNTDETVAFIVCTSGSTGLPKGVDITHKNILYVICYVWCTYSSYPVPTKLALVLSSLHWMTAGIAIVNTALFSVPRLQTSAEFTPEHIMELINIYKPTWSLCSTTTAKALLSHPDSTSCDFSCYEKLYLCGSAVARELIENMQKRLTHGRALNGFGITETSGLVHIHDDSTLAHSCGKPITELDFKLIDVTTGNMINEANKIGELWIRGDSVFKGYHDNEEATREALTPDGFFRTGDLFYQDEMKNHFFVERIKMMLKYRSYHISPQELEEVIGGHPGVAQVVVCGVPHEEDGEHPAACIKRAHRQHNFVLAPVTAQEIKDLVKGTLSHTKQLRGGVFFVEEMPLTPSLKLDRKKIKEIVLAACSPGPINKQ